MNYHWTECPDCRCHVVVNWTTYPDNVSGSLRRWSSDRSTNDGRGFQTPRAAGAAGPGGFAVSCVCGRELSVPETPSAVGGERSEDLRVKLTTGD